MTGAHALLGARAVWRSGCMVPEAGNVPIFNPSAKLYVAMVSGQYFPLPTDFVQNLCIPLRKAYLGPESRRCCRCSYPPDASEANLKKK